MSNQVANIEIREMAKKSGVHLWQIADALGIYDFSLSRMLRHELSVEEKIRILSIINDLASLR